MLLLIKNGSILKAKEEAQVKLLRAVPGVPKNAAYEWQILEEKDPKLGKVNLLRVRWKKGVEPSVAERVSVIHRLFQMKSTEFEASNLNGRFTLECRVPASS